MSRLDIRRSKVEPDQDRPVGGCGKMNMVTRGGSSGASSARSAAIFLPPESVAAGDGRDRVEVVRWWRRRRPPLERPAVPRVRGRGRARPQAPPRVDHEEEDAERDPEGAEGGDRVPEGPAGARRVGVDAAGHPDPPEAVLGAEA